MAWPCRASTLTLLCTVCRTVIGYFLSTTPGMARGRMARQQEHLAVHCVTMWQRRL